MRTEKGGRNGGITMEGGAEKSTPPPSSRQGPGGIPGLDWNFLHRTAISTALTIIVVASTVGMKNYAFGLRYGLTAFWILIFLITTAFIFRFMMFEGKVAKGLGVVAVKIGLLGVLLWMLTGWPLTDADGKLDRSQALALVLGLITPFIVLILRVIGFVTNPSRRDEMKELAGIIRQPGPDAGPGTDGGKETHKL